MANKHHPLLDSQIVKVERRRHMREDRKTSDECFDRGTLLAIYDMMGKGLIETVDFPVSTGKEGNVFMATSPSGTRIALKIYRMATANFNAIRMYIEGDPRFKGIEGSKRKIILAWSQKEYRNLLALHDAGVSVPKPIVCVKNVVAMEYIGDENGPAPLLRDVKLEDPQRFYDEIVSNLRKAYSGAHIVHADMSEYNVLVHGGKCIIIDVSQAVSLKHPNAQDFLKRDAGNLARYFSRLGVDCDAERALASIRGDDQ